MTIKYRKTIFVLLLLSMLVALVYLIPANMVIPVQNASVHDWNRDTFWYQPWGKSGVHKGIDIFATMNTPVLSASEGLVVYTGRLGIGGNVVAILGGRWRLHYYAHLQSVDVRAGQWLRAAEIIGRVGNSGNAKGKPPHLHYSLLSLLPRPWRFDGSVSQGWKKMFFLDPGHELTIQQGSTRIPLAIDKTE